MMPRAASAVTVSVSDATYIGHWGLVGPVLPVQAMLPKLIAHKDCDATAGTIAGAHWQLLLLVLILVLVVVQVLLLVLETRRIR